MSSLNFFANKRPTKEEAKESNKNWTTWPRFVIQTLFMIAVTVIIKSFSLSFKLRKFPGKTWTIALLGQTLYMLYRDICVVIHFCYSIRFSVDSHFLLYFIASYWFIKEFRINNDFCKQELEQYFQTSLLPLCTGNWVCWNSCEQEWMIDSKVNVKWIKINSTRPVCR